MEGTVYIPFTVAAKINVPPTTVAVTLFIESSNGHLVAKKSDGTYLTAGTLAGGVVVPLIFA